MSVDSFTLFVLQELINLVKIKQINQGSGLSGTSFNLSTKYARNLPGNNYETYSICFFFNFPSISICSGPVYDSIDIYRIGRDGRTGNVV